jgi:hypothetical protein
MYCFVAVKRRYVPYSEDCAGITFFPTRNFANKFRKYSRCGLIKAERRTSLEHALHLTFGV